MEKMSIQLLFYIYVSIMLSEQKVSWTTSFTTTKTTKFLNEYKKKNRLVDCYETKMQIDISDLNGALLCIHSLCAPKYKHSEHFLVFVVVFKSINIHFIVHNIFSSSDSFIFIYSCCCLCCSDNYSSVYSCCYERKYVLILRAKIK